jgi:hypothetical protein
MPIKKIFERSCTPDYTGEPGRGKIILEVEHSKVKAIFTLDRKRWELIFPSMIIICLFKSIKRRAEPIFLSSYTSTSIYFRQSEVHGQDSRPANNKLTNPSPRNTELWTVDYIRWSINRWALAIGMYGRFLLWIFAFIITWFLILLWNKWSHPFIFYKPVSPRFQDVFWKSPLFIIFTDVVPRRGL